MERQKRSRPFGLLLLFQLKLLLNRSVLLVSGRSQQSADGQGDLLLLLVDRSDLSLNGLALGENVLRLLDAAVSDLRNVDQAVHAGNHLSESAEGHQLDDTNLSGVAHAVLVHEHLPGIHTVVLSTQGCYRAFAYAFGWKVKAAQHVLNYKWGKDIKELDAAVPLLEKSLEYYRQLVDLTKDTYLYANSMQTAQRRIPIGGDGGNMKHWSELLPKYEQELANLKKNIAMLKAQAAGTYKMKAEDIKPLKDATQQKGAFQMENINGETNFKTVKIAKGAKLFNDLDSVVTDFAPELAGMNAYVMNSSKQRGESTSLTFTTKKPVQLLIGYFRDDQMKYAKAPKLETDATANDYGQAEPQLTSAIRIDGMPQVNIHKYEFAAGKHTLLLPKGFLLVLGATGDKITARDAGLSGADKAIDWLFY